MKINQCFLTAICLLLCIASTACAINKPLEPAGYRDAVVIGHLDNQSIKESSGLAASRIYDDVLWTSNDSNHKPILYAIGTDGSNIGAITIHKARNRDWEDLASFRLKNIPYLLIADVGDNFLDRDKYFIYLVREPQIKKSHADSINIVSWSYRIRFTYEDGPHNCESVAVDTVNRKILLLTKEDPPDIYVLNLSTRSPKSDQVAYRLIEVNTLPGLSLNKLINNPEYGPYQHLTTSMDISSNGLRAVVLTYKNAYLFKRNPGEDWAEVFIRPPYLIPLPNLKQAEAICFGSDGKTLFVTSEKLPAPLLRIRVKK